jgi:hypothetical protein
VGQHSGVAVKVDVGWVLVGGALRGGNGDSFIAALADGESRGLRVAHNGGVGGQSLVEAGEARLWRERTDAKKLGDTLRNAAAPKAVEVEIWAKMADFGREAMIAWVGVGGVIFPLERVSEDNDELNGGVGVDGEVEVAAWHFVDFIDN